ncbi:ScbR family autoregulator-binding transcription factor [Streptomyces sp. enrichment culture]|uniref:ScbR family autoregulator-binding transcription factor n=1 Tax=Streptomyces sp. enrichment culture TaxID=1795815 RepID=UPI003F561AB8
MAQARQERAIQTRRALIHAAAEVFDEFGFAGASISRILKRAGVTSGALYFHFDSKEELAKAVMNAQSETIVPFLKSEGLQRLVDITLIWSRRLQTDPLLRAGVRLTGEQATFGLRDSMPYQAWSQNMEECLRTAQQKGELQAGVEPWELAELVVESCTGMQMYAAAKSCWADLPDRVVRMWRLLLPGVAVPAVVARTVVHPARGLAADGGGAATGPVG